RHLRRANWLQTGRWQVPESERALPVKTLTEVRDPQRRDALLAIVGREDEDTRGALQELLDRFTSQAKAGNELSTQGYPASYQQLQVKVSFGKGNCARIPWIAFLESGQLVPKGIYPVLLLIRDENVLLLCYGISEENASDNSWGELGDAPTVREWFQSKFGRN